MLAMRITESVASVRHDAAFAALHRSLDVYYGDPIRDAAMDRLYSAFLGPGDLAFDIGSHVGDRIGSFRRCGARVVAVEPQSDCADAIRRIYADDSGVDLVDAACGAHTGTLQLHINAANPTVTTASADFVRAAAGAQGWESQTWDRSIEVPCVTLDELIARFGAPRFIKIDVEGFEADVLQGLGSAPPALSFEFTTIQRDAAYRCLDRLVELGQYRFDVALGESQRLTFGTSIAAAEMRRHIAALPDAANSGDVYARLSG